MPAGSRIRTNNVQGTVTDNPLTNAATTLNSAGLANLAVVSDDHAVLVLDPLRAAGAPEIVVVTAHAASATSATIVRGQYGTTARQHAAGTLWVHGPITDDFRVGVVADGHAQVTVDQTGIGTSMTDLTDLAVTVDVPADHRIRVTGKGMFQQLTSAGTVLLYVREGEATIDEIGRADLATNGRWAAHHATTLVPSAGVHTYKLSAHTTANTCDLEATSTRTAWILVEDLGPKPA